jgi:uncharacterized protein YdhG (YjbR/CyaY superfamily)
MEHTSGHFTTIDEYIATCAEAVQPMLRELRATIQAAAPDAQEKISYQMPTFALRGNLVHFAAFPHHIGFYPGSSGVAAFAAELTSYKSGKGSVQFPLDQPLPLALISRIVEYRVVENLENAARKTSKQER